MVLRKSMNRAKYVRIIGNPRKNILTTTRPTSQSVDLIVFIRDISKRDSKLFFIAKFKPPSRALGGCSHVHGHIVTKTTGD